MTASEVEALQLGTVEGITMIMAVYLTISLTISVLMNLYNRSVALVER